MTTSPSTVRPPAVVPSVLPADFARLGEDLTALETAGVDRVQWDVMDGRFVPNLTVGPDVVRCARSETSLPFEAHLMVEEPDWSLPAWLRAGCETVIVHAEACRHLHRSLALVRDAGGRAGVALNPATPLTAVEHVLDVVDLLLVMTVDPGFGGQAFLPATVAKVAAARQLLDERAPHVDLEVDGGIGPSTIAAVTAAGATSAVVGSALFARRDDLAAAVADLRSAAVAGRVAA
ncbi:ribulose-phosphate 3-epimerase [Kineosporia sp. R_H_3]|uniref:ribulose-phosphate 3-epimerase n=1 Tax=Kineosporia sp. R_H_3 TaxID=1961848 RepID=UPI000B4AF487|nr:ribulose-phosphate 3-epimerase [Kineosporia sp. R_H_3]